MVKGMWVKLNYYVSYDLDIGVEVICLIFLEVICYCNYFYQKCFFNDGSYLLFVGEFDGYWNYYLLNIVSVEVVQLIEGVGDNIFGGFFFLDDKLFYYVKNDCILLEVNLIIFVECEVYCVSDDWVGYGIWVVNSDCSKLVGIEIVKSDWMLFNDWQIFYDFFYKGLYCCLLCVDLCSGESQVIYEEKIWLGYLIYCFFDDYIVVFCYEGLYDLVDVCMWLVNEDGSYVCKVKVYVSGESCIYEFWVLDGLVLIYVFYLKGQQGWMIYCFDFESGVNEVLMMMLVCLYLMSNFDGMLLVGDGLGILVDVKDIGGYFIDNDFWLYVFNVVEKCYFCVVCYDILWVMVVNSCQVMYLYFLFILDDSVILFSFDKDGKLVIYIVKLFVYLLMLSV